MTEQDIQKAVSNYERELREWLKSQEGQTDAYAYESSFLSFTRSSARESFQLSMGDLPASKNAKKK